jgi:hypothetical protein
MKINLTDDNQPRKKKLKSKILDFLAWGILSITILTFVILLPKIVAIVGIVILIAWALNRIANHIIFGDG